MMIVVFQVGVQVESGLHLLSWEPVQYQEYILAAMGVSQG
jgi:hypothetical protein